MLLLRYRARGLDDHSWLKRVSFLHLFISSEKQKQNTIRVIVDEAQELSLEDAGDGDDAGTQNSALMSPSKMETLGMLRSIVPIRLKAPLLVCVCL